MKKRKGVNKPKHLIAVYGTLRKGLPNHHLIKDAEMVMRQRIKGFAMHSLGAFPAVRDNCPGSEITVEVYHVNDMELGRCDVLEGHPNWYKRTPVGSIDIGDGKQELWMYVMPSEDVRGNELVQSGDWVEYITKRGGE